MGDETGIGWTDHTFNPWLGCTKVSQGCVNCYAETLIKNRMGKDLWGPKGDRQRTAPANWRKPLKWNAEARAEGRRHRVFCASLADVFEDHPVAHECREDLWPLIKGTEWLDWQLLTKRPENFELMLPVDWGDGYPNVWLMVSAEDQDNWDRRVPILLRTPAAVRGVSAEPLLGPIEPGDAMLDSPRISWLIIGGESGTGARPMDLAWARKLLDYAVCDDTPVFMKQLGAKPREHYRDRSGWNVDLKWCGGSDVPPVSSSQREPDWWAPMLKARKGDDPSEWAADLRVQQWPR